MKGYLAMRAKAVKRALVADSCTERRAGTCRNDHRCNISGSCAQLHVHPALVQESHLGEASQDSDKPCFDLEPTIKAAHRARVCCHPAGYRNYLVLIVGLPSSQSSVSSVRPYSFPQRLCHACRRPLLASLKHECSEACAIRTCLTLGQSVLSATGPIRAS